MKICNICKKEKGLEDFNKDRCKKDGYMNFCKECRNRKHLLNKEKNNKKSKEYYSENRDRLLKKSKERKFSKRDLNTKIRKIKEIYKHISCNESVCTKCLGIKDISNFITDNLRKNKLSAYCKECKNEYFREKKKGDILFKLICRLRSRLSKSVRENKLVKKSKTIDILGISIHEFKLYIESKFTDGMSWENYGDWHLDHIEPISYANNEEEVYKLSHYTNFQPLMAFDNLSKGNRYIG